MQNCRLEDMIATNLTGCWLWIGPVTKSGYGLAWKSRRDGSSNRCVMAHRHVYEMLVGEIPEDLELDHLCRCKACVNPEHLEPVTHSVNMLRASPFIKRRGSGESCSRGHAMDGIVSTSKKRYCKTCNVLNKRLSREKAKVSANTNAHRLHVVRNEEEGQECS